MSSGYAWQTAGWARELDARQSACGAPALVMLHQDMQQQHLLSACVVVLCPAQVKSAAIDTYDDHRMAMAFSLAACSGVPITINDPGCTRKTFPTYFKVFESVASH